MLQQLYVRRLHIIIIIIIKNIKIIIFIRNQSYNLVKHDNIINRINLYTDDLDIEYVISVFASIYYLLTLYYDC